MMIVFETVELDHSMAGDGGVPSVNVAGTAAVDSNHPLLVMSANVPNKANLRMCFVQCQLGQIIVTGTPAEIADRINNARKPKVEFVPNFTRL